MQNCFIKPFHQGHPETRGINSALVNILFSETLSSSGSCFDYWWIPSFAYIICIYMYTVQFSQGNISIT